MNRKHLSTVLFLVAFAITVLDYRPSAALPNSLHQKISSYSKDIRRSHRDDVITYRREFLARCQKASEMLPSILGSDLKCEPEHQKTIRTLSRIPNRKIEFVEAAASRVNTKQYDKLITKQYDKPINGIYMGKMLFDGLMLPAVQIESRAKMTMESLRRDAEAQPDLVFGIVISGLIVSLLLFLAALMIIRRSRLKIEKLNHRIDETNKALEDANQALINSNIRLGKANEALQKVNNELNDFSYSVSHDLKAPLRAIRGYCEMLQEDIQPEVDEKILKTINVIARNAKRMDLLINDLLQLARLDNTPLNRQPVNMKTIVEEVIAEQTLPLKTKITLMPMDGAKADPGLVRKVWENLVSNAVKFSSGNESPEIEIGCSNDGSEQVYWVKDNGVGFDPAYSDKLFKVFSRLHAKKEFEGTGAGLTVVKKIIDAHGGRIWAEAEVSKGAVFYFTLPFELNSNH